MSVELQEAEGRVKAARDAYHAAGAEADRVAGLQAGLLASAREKLETAEADLRNLLARERKLLDDRESRAFGAVRRDEEPALSEPLRPIGLSLVADAEAAWPKVDASLNTFDEPVNGAPA